VDNAGGWVPARGVGQHRNPVSWSNCATLATTPGSDYDLRLDAGTTALARGEWADARSIFDALVHDHPTPAALEGQSWAAWWQDDGETVFAARERAYQLFRDAGD